MSVIISLWLYMFDIRYWSWHWRLRQNFSKIRAVLTNSILVYLIDILMDASHSLQITRFVFVGYLAINQK